ELGLLVVLGEAVHQLEAGRNAMRHRRMREQRERMVVELRRGAREFRERAHQRALRLVPLVEQHGWGVPQLTLTIAATTASRLFSFNAATQIRPESTP